MFETYYARKTKKRWIINQVKLSVFLYQWQEAKNQIFTILVDLALKQEATDYTTIGKKIKVWGNTGMYCRDKKLHHILGEISMEAQEKGFPLLSALVYNKKYKEPGGGYWGLLNRYYPNANDYEKVHEQQLASIFSSDWSQLALNKQYIIRTDNKLAFLCTIRRARVK